MGITSFWVRYRRDHKLWYFVPAIYLDAMWMVWLKLLYVVHNYFDAYDRLQNCYYLDAMASCYLKGVPDPVRFYFQGFSCFLTLLCWAKLSFGPVAPPIDHLRNSAWPCTGHHPSFFSLSIIQTTTPAVSFTSILCACVYVDECDWLGLQCR